MGRGHDLGVCAIGTSETLTRDDAIDGRIELHDSNQFEVKLDYTIDPGAERSRYHIQAYFFVPKSLGINLHTYGRDQFYSDIQANIRFKTPIMSFAEMLDPRNELSSFYRLNQLIENVVQQPGNALGSAMVHLRIADELRLLGCEIRAQVRNEVLGMSANLDAIMQASVGPDMQEQALRLEQHLLGFCQELEPVLVALRKLGSSILEPPLAVWLREAFAYVDEYVSITLENHLTALVSQLEESPWARQVVARGYAQACRAITLEQAYRRRAGYHTVFSASRSNEYYVYRWGQLKKFVMSVLFLEISKEKDGGRATHLAAAIAAGVAMLFATVASIFGQTHYSINSLPFTLIIVLSYMLKDRIKESLKQYFSRKMTRWLWDYSVHIKDPRSGATVGRCREAFSFVDLQQVPLEIAAMRHSGSAGALEATSKPEVVMKYEKEVRLLNRQMMLAADPQQRLQDINDIIRFNISSFLARTDDPVRVVPVYNEQKQRVESIACPKVYHLNVVLCLLVPDRNQPPVREHVRVVMDKKGIRRLERG